MAFCTNCGQKLPDGVKFCGNCGSPVFPDAEETQHRRVQTYAGKIIKCPNCGESLDSFVTVCPACGHEIREAENSSAVQEFAGRLSNAATEKEKISIIRNFPIPNTKEDILEFSILASTNINENLNLDDETSDAWFAKLGQAYQKAQILFEEQPEFDRVKQLYDSVEVKISRARKRHKFSEQVGVNGLFAIGWLITVFILIPLCRNGEMIAVFLLITDWIVGAILVPRVCRCASSVPQIISAVGVLLNIVIMVLFAIRVSIYQLLTLFDIIFSAIILVRLFRHGRTDKK